MSLLNYIDNEVPAFGEWTSTIEAGGSTLVQSAAAAWPERGSLGLRATIVGANAAYAARDLSISIDAAGSVWIGFWLRIGVHPGATHVLEINSAAPNCLLRLYLSGIGAPMGIVYDDAGAAKTVFAAWALSLSRWHYIAVELRRASNNVAGDGGAVLYVGGELIDSRYDVDNYDRATDAGELRAGVVATPVDGAVIDLDEFKIATADYPEPYSPTPADEYPSAARTVVLWRRASSDSREFADYCVSELGVPRANLCPLPNASADETVADYATFQAQVETDLAAWLAVNPTIAANCSCFLIGYGVPGCFTHGGVKHSATSRLMNYGTAFSSQTANPLYGTTGVPPVRLTKTALGGKYLATRIDADTLQHAKDVLDCGLQIADCGFLPEDDVLYSDDSTYRASLACQKLRMIAAALAAYVDDAFVWGDTGSPAFGAAGSRACFTDDSADSADTLRAASELFTAMVTNGYAAGVGFSATPCTLLPTPFFEMLRIGGTFAEAVAVATEHIDYTAVAAGHPLMTAAFQVGGYNIYQGTNDPSDIDYTVPVAHLRAGVSTVNLVGLCPVEDVDYWFGVRAVSSAGVEEDNTARIVRVRIHAGALVGPPPNDMDGSQCWAEAAAAGKVRLHLLYTSRGAAGVATGIQVARVTAGVADWANLIQTVAVIGSVRSVVVLDPTFGDGETVRLAVRAVTADGATGGGAFLNPVVADTSAPPAVTYVEASQL